jgi:DNA invertase Pin-like site-specific DNA recombinase
MTQEVVESIEVAWGGVHVGYTRVSTVAQTLEQQNAALEAAGVTKLFSDVMSGARDDRPGLAALMDYVREGDTVVVWKLDRLGRNMIHVLQTVKELTERGVTLVSITDGIDSSTSTGRMMIGILGSLAEYERELVKERTALKRAASRANGTRFGRPRKVKDDNHIETAKRMKADGHTGRCRVLVFVAPVVGVVDDAGSLVGLDLVTVDEPFQGAARAEQVVMSRIGVDAPCAPGVLPSRRCGLATIGRGGVSRSPSSRRPPGRCATPTTSTPNGAKQPFPRGDRCDQPLVP